MDRVNWRCRGVALAMAITLGVGAGMTMVARPALAQQDWPNKPIRVVIPATPGTTSDLLARIVMEPAFKTMGGTMVVEARVGAGGTIAAEAVAKAAPDGYTFGTASMAPLAIAPTLYKTLRFDVSKDFVGVARLATNANVVFATKNAPVASIRELVAYGKTNPGKLNFALVGGYGTSYHMGMVMLGNMTGASYTFVPFKSNVDTLQAMLSSDVPAGMGPLSAFVAHLKDGTLRPLAVTGAVRSIAMPELPTMAEAGVPGYELSSWFGVIAPAGTSPALVQRVSSEILKVLANPEVQANLVKIGFEVAPMGAQEFEAFRRREAVRWGEVVKSSGMKLDQ